MSLFPRQDRPIPFSSLSGLYLSSMWPLLPCLTSRQLLVTKSGPAEGLALLQWDSRLNLGHPPPCQFSPLLSPRVLMLLDL